MKDKEIFYGEQGAPKMEKLNEGLLKIEEKYLEYFKERSSRNSFEEHDRLHNHYIMTTNPFGCYFGFEAESDLKEEIKAECQMLFNEIFDVQNTSASS